MKDGAVISEKLVSDALGKKGLSFVSQSAVPEDSPEIVYVLSVSGVG